MKKNFMSILRVRWLYKENFTSSDYRFICMYQISSKFIYRPIKILNRVQKLKSIHIILSIARLSNAIIYYAYDLCNTSRLQNTNEHSELECQTRDHPNRQTFKSRQRHTLTKILIVRPIRT